MSVFEKHFVEITETEKQYRVPVFLFDLQILAHHRRDLGWFHCSSSRRNAAIAPAGSFQSLARESWRQATRLRVQFAYQAANAKREHKVPFHGIENLPAIIGDHKQTFAICQIFERGVRPHGAVRFLSERFQTAADFLEIEPVARQIFHDLEANEVVKRI